MRDRDKFEEAFLAAMLATWGMLSIFFGAVLFASVYWNWKGGIVGFLFATIFATLTTRALWLAMGKPNV